MTPSAAGKGSDNRTSDFKAYRASRLWWRSACCGAKVVDAPFVGPAGEELTEETCPGYDAHPKTACTACGFRCTIRRDGDPLFSSIKTNS